MGKGGGNQTVTQYTSNIPKFAEPYYHYAMEEATAEAKRPYQTYEGQRLPDRTAQTTAGMNMAQNWAQSGTPQLNNAQSLAGAVGTAAMDLQNYQAGGVHNTYTGPAEWQNGQFTADQVGTGAFGAGERDQYMSPYMESVIQNSQDQARRQAMEEQGMIKAQQGQTSAFGGSRGAMQQQMAADAAQQRITDIGVQGRQAAFENAQQQFERDQKRSLDAQISNQLKNLEALGMGEASRQFGYAKGEEGRQKASELGMMAESETEKYRQSGKDLGLRGLSLASTTAGQFADFQKQLDSRSIDQYKTMLGIGQMQSDEQREMLNMRYQDFQDQNMWNRGNLSWFNSMMAGQPANQQSNTTQTTTTPQNNLQGGAGFLMGYNAMNNINNQ